MAFCFKSSHLASSISVMTVAVGLAFGPLTTEKSLAQTVINGAGSTFVSPFLTTVDQASAGITINYAGVGSGNGRTAFLTQTPPSGDPTVPAPISFGASDSPLASPAPSVTGSPNRGPAVQVPVITGGITLAYNPSGLTVPAGGLRLSRRTYCGILDGQITNWNSPAITADNSGRRVAANLPIRVVRRSDSSGTTFNLSNHLNTVCRNLSPSSYNWDRGAGNTVSWPSTFIGVEGGSAVIRAVASTRGGFGYADESTRLSASGVTVRPLGALLQNQAGNYVAPTPAAVSAAFTGAVDTDTNPRIITLGGPTSNPTLLQNPTGGTAYPIVGQSYLLFYDVYASSSVATGIRSLITTGFSTQGDTAARNLGYAPLPETLQSAVTNVVQIYVDTSAN